MKLRRFNGFSPAGCQLAGALFQQGCIPRDFFSAGACGLVRGGEYWTQYFGRHQRLEIDPQATETNAASRFDIASVTKSVPVALLTLWASFHGFLSLRDQVRTFFPNMHILTSDEPTIEDLLSYRVRLHLDHLKKPYDDLDRLTLFKQIKEAHMTVGHTLHYSNYPPILLGWILEMVTGCPLDSLAENVLFRPLGMDNTTFMPEAGNRQLYVATERDRKTGQPLCGVVHDEITQIFNRPSGAAGVFSTCEDMLHACRFILDKGVIDGQQLIHERMIDEMGRNQIQVGTQFGMGFGVWKEFSSGFDPMEEAVKDIPEYGDGAFFKNGFTGTMIAIFPKLDTGIVILTNHVHPTRKSSTRWINQFRHAVIMTLLTGGIPKGTATLWGKD